LRGSEYSNLVEKLACEIIDEASNEIEKEANFKKKLAKSIPGMIGGSGYHLGTAVRKAVSPTAGDRVDKALDFVKNYGNVGKATKSAKRLAGKKYIMGIGLGGTKKGDKKRLLRAGALYGGGAAAVGGGALLANKMKKKSFEILEEAQMQKIAASEAMEEATMTQELVLQELASLGIDPEEFLAEIAEM
jgi:hypothetical protein